jgi:exopolysaccharide biosynthesis WecB/TagA/CpsF family protein
MREQLAATAVYHRGERLHLLGVDIDNYYMSDAIEMILRRAQAGLRSRFAFANADCLNQAYKNFHYEYVLAHQNAVFADGSGVALAARMHGENIVENINGTDMFPLLCEQAAMQGVSVFLLGGRDGRAAETARRMQELYPGLKIAGTRHGCFTAEEEDGVIHRINESGAGILLVAFGAPHQEIWIDAVRDELAIPVCIGVGGLFDYYSGHIPRAPKWMRETGCEWIWRLRQEPLRLSKRYLVGNPVFLFRCLKEMVLGPKRLRSPVSTSRIFFAKMKRKAWQRRLGLVAALKRGTDIIGGFCALTLLSPVLIGTAIAIRLESSGAVLFTQTRVGMNGRRFKIYKFRSMYIDAEERRRQRQFLEQSDRQGAYFKMKDDPRVTRVGRIIRKLSIDELPQLWNVLNGTMSLVGPRPNLESEVERYKLYELGRLAVRPGITCFRQVSGRADLPWEWQVELDFDHVHQRSLKTDLKLMLKTIPAVIGGRGAY